MRNSITIYLSVCFVFACSQLLAKNSCVDYYKDTKASQSKVSHFERILDAQIASVRSPESLGEFFEQISPIAIANHEANAKMSSMLFQELGPEGVSRLVESLLLSHSHLSERAVKMALKGFATGDVRNAREVQRYLPHPFQKETFLKWVKLGETFKSNKAFLSKLNAAISDYSIANSQYYKIDTELTYFNLTAGLESLQNPSLLGRFMEVFSKADAATREYLITSIVETKVVDGTNSTAVLKGAKTPNSEIRGAAQIVFDVVSKSLDELQELALFERLSHRNNVVNVIDPTSAVVKNAAIRYSERRKKKSNIR